MEEADTVKKAFEKLIVNLRNALSNKNAVDNEKNT